MNKGITILDATLREGEQQCGIRFSKEDKITLLHMLENFGVTLIYLKVHVYDYWLWYKCVAPLNSSYRSLIKVFISLHKMETMVKR